MCVAGLIGANFVLTLAQNYLSEMSHSFSASEQSKCDFAIIPSKKWLEAHAYQLRADRPVKVGLPDAFAPTLAFDPFSLSQ